MLIDMLLILSLVKGSIQFLDAGIIHGDGGVLLPGISRYIARQVADQHLWCVCMYLSALVHTGAIRAQASQGRGKPVMQAPSLPACSRTHTND